VLNFPWLKPRPQPEANIRRNVRQARRTRFGIEWPDGDTGHGRDG
jgi:hypothetical protein